MVNATLMRRIANEVENLLTQNPLAKDRFIEQLKVFNIAWKKYWTAKDNELLPLTERPDKSIESLYEHDSDFQCWFPKNPTKLPPDPTMWELNDKHSCYYATLAVIYDLEKGSIAPFTLCEGILDTMAFSLMQIYLSRTQIFNKDMLDTALKWVKADIEAHQEKDRKISSVVSYSPRHAVRSAHDIANIVDHLITNDKDADAYFKSHITKLCDMVEKYAEALQPYAKKLKRAQKRWKQNGTTDKSLTEFCPPPTGWIQISFKSNLYVKIDMSLIYRPAEPVNPLLWFGLFGNANIQRQPTEKEKLMCDYVLLALVHDWELQRSGKPIDRRIFSTDYKGNWFKLNEFCEDVWKYYHYEHQGPDMLFCPTNPQEKLSQLSRSLEHVQADLGRNKPAQIGQKIGLQEKDGESKTNDVPTLTEDEAQVLDYLNEEHPQIRYQQDIVAVCKRDRKTIRAILKKLMECGFVCLPEGKKKGYVITSNGKDYLNKHF